MANPAGHNGIKSDDLTIQLRVRSVMEWILQGYITKDIVSQGISKWNIDARTVKIYISRAKKEFRDSRKGKIEERIDFYIAAKMKLYNELRAKDTPAGASVADKILESMANLEGLNVKKIQHTGPNGDPLIPDDPLKVSTNKLIISVINAPDSNTITTSAESVNES